MNVYILKVNIQDNMKFYSFEKLKIINVYI